MRKTLFTLLCLLLALNIGAQEYSLQARLISSLDSLPVKKGLCEVYRSGDAFIGQFQWDENGFFFIRLGSPGKYQFLFKAEGFQNEKQDIVVDKPINLGNIILKDNAIRLKIVTIKGKAQLQMVRGDTVLYNPSALPLSPDATLKDAIQHIPDIEITDGVLKWKGKNINQILVNGQDFFGQNKSIALDHLPATSIANIKVYDKASEFTEKTGVEDGNKKTVMDVSLKNNKNAKWLGDVHLSGGTEEQYEAGGFASRFTSKLRTSLLLETTSRMPTMIDMGSGKLTGGGWQYGKNHNQQYAAELVWNNGKKSNQPGFVYVNTYFKYNSYKQANYSRKTEETYLPQSSPVYRLSSSNDRRDLDEFQGNVSLKWQIDSLTYGTAGIQYTNTQRQAKTVDRLASFREPPYYMGYGDFPLDILWSSQPSLEEVATNSNERKTLETESKNKASLNATVIRKLGKNGRSLMGSIVYTYQEEDNNQHTLAHIRYYGDPLSSEQTNRQYLLQDGRHTETNLTFRYSEPLAPHLSLLLTYNYSQISNRNIRPVYQLDNLGEGWDSMMYPVGDIPNGDLLLSVLNRRNSIYSQRYKYNHTAELKLSYTGKGWSVAAGLALHPEKSTLDYNRDYIDTNLVRKLCYIAPTLYVKRVFNKRFTADANYTSKEKYPNLMNMVSYTDDTDPLNVNKGNPDLVSSRTHNASLSLRFYDSKKDLSITNNLRFAGASNDISSALHYDAQTGIRTVRPENVDGNFILAYKFGSTVALEAEKRFRLSPAFDMSYQKYHSLVSLNGLTSTQTRTSAFRGTLSTEGIYQKNKTKVTLYGGWSWEKTNNNLQSNFNETHYAENIRSQQIFYLPWNIRIQSQIDISWHQGYTYSQMNYMEYVWNLTAGRSFLKKNRLNINLSCYDLLKGKKRRWYSITAYSNSSTEQYYIDSFIMLTLKYML